MKVGISTMFFGDMKEPELFSLLGRHPDIKVVDFWYDTPFHLLELEARRAPIVAMAGQRLEKICMEVVTHAAAFDVNPIAYSPAMQRHTLAETEASIEFANAVGAKLVTVHGGFSSFGTRVSSYDRMLFERFILELIGFVETKGFDITLCVENDAATEIMARPLESLHILNDVLDKNPGLCMALDVSHVIKTTSMAPNLVVREPRLDVDALPPLLKERGDRIRIVHLSHPNKYRTHGRIDISRSSAILAIINGIMHCLDVATLPCIFEYALEEFRDPVEAMDSIVADAAAISRSMLGE